MNPQPLQTGTGARPTSWLKDGYAKIWMPYTQMETAPLPQAAVSTEGTRITLANGNQLIDGVASWWSACHGYNHPHIQAAVIAQVQQMPHVMLAGMGNEPAFTLAQRLAALTPNGLERVFFSESGSVSVEIAMKMAVQYWLNQGGPEKTKFICFKGAYHGDTITAMSVGDPEDGIHGRFAGLVPNQPRTPLPRDEASHDAFKTFVADHADRSAAMILEPLVQGAAGMIFHDPKTLRAV
ncbi:MAG TPA: aminotransferase class III-fold pyridoxal phosphate-dependent enzyme, partial [Rhodospirillales bacterium]|nr:aminotransferase class III-fold pyridoxal phosphate-dependent enzyme [Rhodospirillales bacterium]